MAFHNPFIKNGKITFPDGAGIVKHVERWAKVRGDRILAVDADPDGGNLADRAGRQSAATISDLLSDKELARYNDIRAYTSMNASNLEVLSSAEYSVARRDFNEEDWAAAVKIVSQYYNLVLADCGAGLFHQASRAVLSTVSGLVIVASASIDGARQAAVTMDWLRQNGYQDLLSRSCVVINHVTPGKTNIDVEDLVQQFERAVATTPQIVRCLSTTGQADYILTVLVPGIAEYEQFLHAELFKLPGVTHVRSSIVLKEIKAEVRLPVSVGAPRAVPAKASRTQRRR